MALTKIRIYHVSISGSFAVVCKNDQEAVDQAKGWVKEDVTRLNFAAVGEDGFQYTQVITPTAEAVPG